MELGLSLQVSSVEVGMDEARPIESLRNLGPASARWLREAGIATVEELERLGPTLAFRIVRRRRSQVTLNLLWSLVAGLRDVDWRELTEAEKRRWLDELDDEPT